MGNAPHKIVVVGSSGHARVALDVIRCQGSYEVAGLIDSFKPAGEAACGSTILGAVEDIPELREKLGLQGYLIAVGDNAIRARITVAIEALVPGFLGVVAVHPAATVASDVQIGQGTLVMAGAVLNPGCVIGKGCIVNTRASLDHDGVLKDFVSLAPGVCAGGNVSVGTLSAVGLGAMIIHGRTVGANTVIGAGAVVVRDLPADAVAYGNPCRVIRSRAEGDKYL
jgi:sugar O-acyltransferase (sialic acid O-acetyltransferase NeuD family)